MRQSRSDLNADSTASRKNLRPAFTIVAGLIALAIAAVVVVDERSGPATAASDPGRSTVSPLAATVPEGGTAVMSTTSAGDAARPHFERSEEPANDEDSVHPYGG